MSRRIRTPGSPGCPNRSSTRSTSCSAASVRASCSIPRYGRAGARSTRHRPPRGSVRRPCRTLESMDDERWEPGMPVLDRQAVAGQTTLPPSLRGLPPRSVPETEPTPLQRHYINLSVVVLICGAIAISALELGVSLGSPLVKLCVVIAAPLLVVTTAEAVLRIWRSAWAWMPVDRGKGMFRLAWVAVSVVGLVALVGAAVVVLLA